MSLNLTKICLPRYKKKKMKTTLEEENEERKHIQGKQKEVFSHHFLLKGY